MIIHIEICDVCRRINRGGMPVTTVQIQETETPLGAMQWDVGHCCDDKPFRVVRHTSTIKSDLLARIEALIVTELALNKKVL